MLKLSSIVPDLDSTEVVCIVITTDGELKLLWL